MIIRDKVRAIVWLQVMIGLTSQKINTIDDKVDIVDLMREPAKYYDKVHSIIGEAASKRLIQPFELKQIDDILILLNRKGCGVIIRGDAEYPDSLDEIDVPPAILYYKGDIGLLKTRCLGVVGTREPSRYGRDYTEKFVELLAKCSLTIVSGLARGVDAIAHRVSLQNHGKTIAVLGCGIDIVYPAVNAQLYEDIARDGLIISEYPLGTPSLAYNFPERNRIHRVYLLQKQDIKVAL